MQEHVTRLESRGVRWTLRQLAVHDWMAFAYLMALVLALEIASAPTKLLLRAGLVWVFVTVAIAACRATKHPSPARVLLYRAALIASVLASYLLLSDALPVLNDGSLDAQLFHLDQWLFGFEPALAFEGWIGPRLTELMSVAYLAYFGILAVVVVPLLFVRGDYQQSELVLALLLIYVVGQAIYVLVPGYGPVVALPHAKALPHGFWYDTMMSVVQRGGAQKDIFPSLHTAMPAVVAAWCYRHRRRFGMTWLVVAAAGSAVAIAALYLRWHYLIDVVAGLILAAGAHLLAMPIVDWELQRRQKTDAALWPVRGRAALSKISRLQSS